MRQSFPLVLRDFGGSKIGGSCCSNCTTSRQYTLENGGFNYAQISGLGEQQIQLSLCFRSPL